jgi:large subunit ribosomal protein L4
MKLKVFNTDGSSSEERDFEGLPVFEGNKGLQALKETVVAQAANIRQGTRSTKTRGEVSGGGKKPWRQKGTGRARAGSSRSPIWTGGGVVFGPRPRDFTKKTNRKTKQLAFKRAFFDRVQAGEVSVIASFEPSPVKTRIMDDTIGRIAPSGTVLLIDDTFSDDAVRAGRNIARIDFAEAAHVNTTELCLFDQVIVSERGLQSLLTRMNGGAS